MEMRDPDLHGLKIKMVYVRWLFRPCSVCHMEFRKTAMWTWLGDEDYGLDKIRKYACQACVPSYDKLLEHLSPKKTPGRPSGRYLKD